MDSEREFYTPPELGREWGTGSDKVLGWIHSGELPAVNFAASVGGRPRWRISRADAEQFLRSRSSTPAPPAKTRRRRQPSGQVKEFF